MYKSSIIDIEHYLIMLQIWSTINSPSELQITINLYNIYIYIYIYIYISRGRLLDEKMIREHLSIMVSLEAMIVQHKYH